jgi:hypothetical protein
MIPEPCKIMTDNSDGIHNIRGRYLGALVPLLAFGGTLAAIALLNAGVQFEIQFAAAGGFLASCLLAYLAWTRLNKDIVALSTPIYGLIFMVTPIDYTGGVVLQLLYACGLTILTARLYHRFGTGTPDSPGEKTLAAGPLSMYVESTRDAFAALGPGAGHAAAAVFISFSMGEYGRAEELSHTAVCQDGTNGPVIRAFSILGEHADLLEKNQPRPETYLKFLPDDAALMAKPLTGSKNPDHEFETQMDNALLLLFSAAWHSSPADRTMLSVSQGFANKLLES